MFPCCIRLPSSNSLATKWSATSTMAGYTGSNSWRKSDGIANTELLRMNFCCLRKISTKELRVLRIMSKLRGSTLRANSTMSSSSCFCFDAGSASHITT